MGASSGIGREVALLFLQQGWQVGLAARRQECLNELAQQYPGQAIARTIDVTKPAATDELLHLIAEMEGVDIYFHAAGVGKQNVALQTDIELDTVATNCLGFTQMIDTAFNYMREQGGGQIVAITSIAGTKGLSRAPSYSATKAFQQSYLQALDQLSCSLKLNIGITDIRPGFVDTPLIQGSNFPMLMDATKTAQQIFSIIKRRQRVAVIDARYRLLNFCWRLLPNALWRRINLMKF